MRSAVGSWQSGSEEAQNREPRTEELTMRELETCNLQTCNLQLFAPFAFFAVNFRPSVVGRWWSLKR
jgi:hypothetical protein